MSKKINTVEFIKRCVDAHGNRYDYVNLVYITSHVKVEVVCRVHGSFWQRPSDHRRGFGCPSCSNKKPHTLETFIEKAENIHSKRYDYSKVDFQTIDCRMTVICRIHGSFIVKARDHIHGSKTGCPTCCLSKGEVAIADTLSQLKIEYVSQKVFSGIKARFDFYLPQYNMCIEFDGAQHFYSRHTRHHFSETEKVDEFKKIQQRDQNKNTYCLNNDILLLRISYLQLHTIKSILNEIFYNTAPQSIRLESFRNEQLFLSSSAIYQRP
jgi:very-short-patch-repair endonuclease